jgi:hypothetical protein
MSARKSSLEQLQKDAAAAWGELVKASFSLTNAVNADAGLEPICDAETALRTAAIGFGEAHAAVVDSLRPSAPRSRKR